MSAKDLTTPEMKRRWDWEPVAFNTLDEAVQRARFWEDRVDAVKDYEDTMKDLSA